LETQQRIDVAPVGALVGYGLDLDGTGEVTQETLRFHTGLQAGLAGGPRPWPVGRLAVAGHRLIAAGTPP
jgi:hypothetical protein